VAIELEHATIPPYLYALYSLASTNSGVASIIQSIVAEEMLHLALAANVLNAIGGRPVLDSESFIPRYPGPLPGAVEHELEVGLAPCSLDLIKDSFMVIEQPEHPLEFHTGTLNPGEPLTIGQFYRIIRATIVEHGDSAFSHRPRNQVTSNLIKDSVVVTDAVSACRAIDIIIDQGEGTAKTPREITGTGYAHYYRFAEIVNGHRLIRNPEATPTTPPGDRYIYCGEPITFEAKGVCKIPTNPRIASYPEGSAQWRACATFNYTYTCLLKCLHVTFNGKPNEFHSAIGIMMSLRKQALDMMTGTTTAGKPTGPSFEWRLVNN
jgi:hypothetical protein